MSRRYPGQRAVHVSFRTAHIACSGITLGAVTLGVEAGPWPWLAAVTGSLLVADDLYKYGLDWFRWVASWSIIAKLALLQAGLVFPEFLLAAVWSAVAIGGVISHAPGSIRQAPLWGEPGPCAAARQSSTFPTQQAPFPSS